MTKKIMFLHLGQDVVVRTKSIIGVFDLDRCTVSKRARSFLSENEKNQNIENISKENLPQTFIVCEEDKKAKIYISAQTAGTIIKRKSEFGGTYFEKK